MNDDCPPTSLEEKDRALDALLRGLGSVLVAYSGGVDSAFLLLSAHEALGVRAVGALAVSPSLAEAERVQAISVAAEIGARLELVEAHEDQNPDYAVNRPDRCFYCKTELFEVLAPVARRLGLAHMVYGANHDDLGDFRPGMTAARQCGARAPLLEAGLTKADIRELARRRGLSVWDKPSFACLASRIPHGTPVTRDRLARVERAEEFFRRHGFRQFRVRDFGTVARVELLPAEMERLTDPLLYAALQAHLSPLGFERAVIDPEGYRTGKLNAPGLASGGGDIP